jgi:hypothetical protein
MLSKPGDVRRSLCIYIKMAAPGGPFGPVRQLLLLRTAMLPRLVLADEKSNAACFHRSRTNLLE